MKPKIFSFLILAVLLIRSVQGQDKIEFSYDPNGNRTSRTLVTEQLKSESVQFPVLDSKSLKSEENIKAAESESEAVSTLVYPNPNKGLIKVEIINMPLESKNELRLFDLSGVQLIIKRKIESYSEVDLSGFKNGIYILRIKVNDMLFDWKVIKDN